MAAKSRFDWPLLLKAAAARGIQPAAFWSLTPPELRALIKPSGPPPLVREGVEALMQLFPDGD